MKTKTFDCLEMKRQGAEKVQQELAGMTLEEEIAFWRNGTEELKQRQKQVRAAGEIETLPLPGGESPKRGGTRAQSGRE